MTILRDLSMLWSLFHILILFMLLYRSRYPRKKTFLLTGLTMGPLGLLTMVGLAVYGAEVMGKVFILTLTLPSLLFFWFMSKDKKGKFFFTFCLADTVALWIIAVTNIVDFYFGGQTVYSDVDWQAGIVSVGRMGGISVFKKTVQRITGFGG